MECDHTISSSHVPEISVVTAQQKLERQRSGRLLTGRNTYMV